MQQTEALLDNRLPDHLGRVAVHRNHRTHHRPPIQQAARYLQTPGGALGQGVDQPSQKKPLLRLIGGLDALLELGSQHTITRASGQDIGGKNVQGRSIPRCLRHHQLHQRLTQGIGSTDPCQNLERRLLHIGTAREQTAYGQFSQRLGVTLSQLGTVRKIGQWVHPAWPSRLWIPVRQHAERPQSQLSEAPVDRETELLVIRW